jgi:recombination protein RecT
MPAQTVGAAVAQRTAGPITLMWSKKDHLSAVLPDHIDVKAFLGTAAGALYASTDLMEAAESSPDSLITALMRCAALGHQPGTDEFYLTPRKDHGRPKILGIEGYRGVIERMYRSGAVSKVVVREVCARDKFRYVEGVDDRPFHSFGGEGTTGADFFGAAGSRDRGEMVGVYAYAELTTGAVSRVVILNRDDVHAARDSGGYKGPGDKFTPWNRDDGGAAHPEFRGRSMWWKTAAKRLEPWVPTSAEYRREQLRASASAAAQAGPPPEQHATVIRDDDIADAELVEPAGQLAAPAPARPSGAAMGKLGKLLTQVPLGDPDAVRAYIEWQTGHSALEQLSRDDVTTLTQHLTSHLSAAEGNAEAAAGRIWEAYREAAAASGEDGERDG